MIKTIVVTGGNLNKDFVKQYFKENTANYIIAVDKGLETLHELSIQPTHIIGDFDSVNSSILDKYTTIHVNRLEPEKDFTDTHMALKLAINIGATNIIILGAIGSRLDHTLANIHILKETLDNNIECILLDENNEIQLIDSDISMKKSNKKYISLIPLTTKVTNVSLNGFKYNLNNATLNIGESIGISNEQEDDNASIKLKEGILIVIKSKD